MSSQKWGNQNMHCTHTERGNGSAFSWGARLPRSGVSSSLANDRKMIPRHSPERRKQRWYADMAKEKSILRPFGPQQAEKELRHSLRQPCITVFMTSRYNKTATPTLCSKDPITCTSSSSEDSNTRSYVSFKGGRNEIPSNLTYY